MLVLSQGGAWTAGIVHADDDFEGCDFITSETDGLAPSALCTGLVDTNRTLYGVTLYVVTAQTSPDLYAQIIDNTGGGPNSCQLVNDLLSPGFQTVAFPIPIDFVSGEKPQVQFFTNNGCTVTGSGLVIGGDGATFPYSFQVFQWSVQGLDDANTRIISVTPDNGSTIATSTTATIGAFVFVNWGDYESLNDMFIRISFVRNEDLQTAVANKSLLYTTYEFPITHDLSTVVSTTTSLLRTGVYTMVTQIRSASLINSVLGWFGLENLYDPGLVREAVTTFTVVEPTTLDTFIADMASTTNAILNSGFGTGLFENIGDFCNPISGFDVLECLSALLLPNQAQMSVAVDTLNSMILTKAPLGYVTRVVTLFSETATSSLPVIDYTFGSGSPYEGESLGFDFGEIITESNDIIRNQLVSDQDDPQNLWDIFMPVWNTLVYVFLLYLILDDVTGIYKGNRKL